MQLLVKTCVCVCGCGAGCMREGVWRAACGVRTTTEPKVNRYGSVLLLLLLAKASVPAASLSCRANNAQLDYDRVRARTHTNTKSCNGKLVCSASMHCAIACWPSLDLFGGWLWLPLLPGRLQQTTTRRFYCSLNAACMHGNGFRVCVGRRRDILARYPWQHCAVNKIINDRYFRFVYTMFGWRKA